MFQNRLRTQEEIEKLLECCFETTDSMDIETFTQVVETKCSDLLICILTVIRDHLPCTETFWDNMKKFYNKDEKVLNSPKRTVPSPKFVGKNAF